MPAVICDTGPLNYLILIEAADILPRLFSPVLVPGAVKAELQHHKAPAVVRDWIAHHPSWLSVVPSNTLTALQISNLDLGECEVIAMSLDRTGSLALMDDRHATTAAAERGLQVIGTLAVLDRAAAHGWISLSQMFGRLQATSFRAPVRLMARMLEQDALRRK
jgi:predicted nucleic acid-binding protein